MDALVFIGVGFLGLSLAGTLLFFLYPAALWIAARARGRPDPPCDPAELPAVSVLTAVRNGQEHIGHKIANGLALDYPPQRLDLVVFSDGSTDQTERIIRSCAGPRVRADASGPHIGKAEALNRAFRHCRGEIVVFSDADAMLEPGAVRALVRHFADPRVGGVCGRRVIDRDRADLGGAQSRYIGFDSAIKALESRLGRITSNDGTLYAIRRELFQPVPGAVTDDLWVGLNVIARGHRFLFEPRARARIRVPSRGAAHEVERRRRIVSRSLRGIFLMRGLLNPARHGVFALGLLVNKVLRRLLPVFLLLLLATSALLAPSHPAAAALLALQGIFYAAALGYPVMAGIDALLGRRGAAPLPGPRRALRRAASIPFYFCVGNYGTLRGLADFLVGRKVTRWDPRKTDRETRPSPTDENARPVAAP